MVSNVRAPARCNNLTCVVSPLEPKRPFDGGPPKVDINYRLKLNISAEMVNGSSVLVSWEKEQRRRAANFCGYRYEWQLDVLTWEYSELYNYYKFQNDKFNHIWNQSYSNDTTKVRNTFSISTTDCKNSRVYINVSNSSYYKFQIKVYQLLENDKKIVKGSNFSGSYLYYFGIQSELD